MENCENLKKSVLKKSDLKKEKKVTFCSTVKVFIDELPSCQNNGSVNLPLNCIEVNIIDKSNADSTDVSKNDDCNATDFLVHKVVYESNIESEDVEIDVLNEEVEDDAVLFETNNEDEGLHFVVHKVTDHEDDLIQQELDLEDNEVSANLCEEMECDSDIIGRLSKLSLENILAHDKIIAFIDQNTLGLSSLLKSHINATECITAHTESSIKNNEKMTVSPCLKSSDLILSPPLQELGLDKIVKAQSDNVLCEFDISPLNSILETDSDSDISSEGTMIMMTSEESEKNEQHIKESFQKYQSLKRQKVRNTHLLSESNESNMRPAKELKRDLCVNAFSNNISKEDSSGNQTHEMHFTSNSLKEMPSVCEAKSDTIHAINTSKSTDVLNPFQTYDPYTSSCSRDFNDSLVNEDKNISLAKNSCYWDNSLVSVQIPKDVREWKIITSEKTGKSDFTDICPSSLKENNYLSLTETETNKDITEVPETSVKSDELENFALASKERVQRIRKRYLSKAQRKAEDSPIQGVKPRFSSTAEILQIVQKQNHHSLFAYNNRSHVSWPSCNAISNSHTQRTRHLNEMFHCQSLPCCEYSSQSALCPSASDDSSSNCDHDSVSSCPSIFFHERGVPEGASPPQSLSEDSIESCTDSENPNIVYFSMKV